MPEIITLLFLSCAVLLAFVRPWFALVLILMLGLFGSLFFDLLISRFTEPFGPRFNLQLLSLQHFIESPFWGAGFGRLGIDVGTAQHDGYTALLGEMGLIGFILFYSLPFMLLFRVHRKRRSMKRSGINDAQVAAYGVSEAFMGGILILNLFNIIVFAKTVFFLFAVIRLLLMGKGRRQTRGSVAMIEFIESPCIGGASQSSGVSHDLGQVGRWSPPPQFYHQGGSETTLKLFVMNIFDVLLLYLTIMPCGPYFAIAKCNLERSSVSSDITNHSNVPVRNSLLSM